MRCCSSVALGCVGTYIAMDVQRVRAQEKRQARQLEIHNALWVRKAEMLEQFHDFATDLQKQGAVQAASDSGKLVLAVIPAVAVLGDAAEALDNAVNLHDLYGILSALKDITDLDVDQESQLMDVLSRNELGRKVLEGKIEIAAMESELATLGSDNWGGKLETQWAWWIPSTYWRCLFSAAWRSGCSGAACAHDKYEKVFRIIDRDGDGCINRAEFKRALQRLEAIEDHWKELSKGDARVFFSKADADGDGKISVEDFALWVRTTSELVAYFQAHDDNCDGLIDKKEFKEVLTRVSEKMQQMQEKDAELKGLANRDVDAEFKEIDSNEDGQINLPEFVGWMQGSTALGFYTVLSRMVNKSRARASSALEWSASNLAVLPKPDISGLQAPNLTGWSPRLPAWSAPTLPAFCYPWRRQAPAANSQPDVVADAPKAAQQRQE